MTTNAPTINACETCGGTGRIPAQCHIQHDNGTVETRPTLGYCPDCLADGYCPRCGADNINVGYVNKDGYTWAWDGETPCPACGWKLADAAQPAQQVQP
jgi:hypothetical protein